MAHSSRDSLARRAMTIRILTMLGLPAAALPLAGCGGNVIVEDGAGGQGGSAQSSSASGSTVSPQPGCDLEDTGDIRHECLPIPINPAPCPSAAEAQSALWEQIQGTQGCEGSGSCCDIVGTCGPDAAELASTGECCYDIAVSSYGCEGRPYLDGDEVRTAEITARADWLSPAPPPNGDDLDERTRAVLAEHYRQAALFEHASVASFARFALELLALGAPADLVASAHRAMGDEIRHATISFSLASAYGGAAVGPTAMPLLEPIAPRSFADLASAVAFEGCLNETISSLIAKAEHDRATDPAVRAALGSIAEEEAEHAVLAWRALDWLLSSGGEPVAQAISRVFRQTPSFEPRALPELGADKQALEAHGCLGAEERRRIADAAVKDVVMPCIQALVSTSRVTDKPKSAELSQSSTASASF